MNLASKDDHRGNVYRSCKVTLCTFQYIESAINRPSPMVQEIETQIQIKAKEEKEGYNESAINKQPIDLGTAQ